MPGDPGIVLAALVLEACLGYPAALLRAVGHPVTWIGRLIEVLERAWNRAADRDGVRRALGSVTAVIVIAVPAGAGFVLEHMVQRLEYGSLLVVVLATVGLAQRSLHEHVLAVSNALRTGDLQHARAVVGRIVGRDTANLNQGEISAAALESLAESFNDAVVAPAFWLLIGGLPGLFAYKAINTADSMIGHKEARWRMFGWAAARLDDLANLIPARIAGILLTTAGGRGFRVMCRDAEKHASPNAGWPEAALAGALSLRLGGPAYYDGELHSRASFGDGHTPRSSDIQRGLALYRRACALLWLLLALIYLPGSTL